MEDLRLGQHLAIVSSVLHERYVEQERSCEPDKACAYAGGLAMKDP